MLVLHLGGEFGRLEHALAVPVERLGADWGGGAGGDIDVEPLVQEHAARFGLLGVAAGQRGVEVVHRDHLDLVDDAVVLGVEDAVDRRQGDVFVAAAVANDVVRVEQFVVVGEFATLEIGGDGVAGDHVFVGAHHGGRCRRVVVDVRDSPWLGVVGDVIEEGVAGAQHVGADADWGGEIALDEAGGGDQLGQAIEAGDELAVGVREDHRHVEHVGVGQLDAEHRAGHQLDFAPIDDGAARAFGQLAGGDRLA